MIRTISLKILLLIFVFAGLNLIYTQFLFEKDLEEKCVEALEIKRTQKNTDIYYFGESSNITYQSGDSIENSISQITNFFFPELRVTNINKYATHAGIYKQWIKEIDLNNNKPKALVITMNLRSFGAAWIHSKLETQLQESMVLTRPYPNLFNRFCLSLQAFDNKTEKQREMDMLHEWRTAELVFDKPFKYKTASEWDYATSQGSFLRPDGTWDVDKIELACHYIKGYAFNVTVTNPRIKDYDEIAAWCNRNGVNLYLNLMAENIEYADSLVGKELVFLMTQNRDFLVNRYSKNNCKVVDNLNLVKGKEFIDQKWTTEHYSYRGRMAIAKNLALSLKQQFKNEFKSAY